MNTSRPRFTIYLAVAFFSGILWAAIANLFFDPVGEFPQRSIWSSLAYFFFGGLTGLLISLAFRRRFELRGWRFWLSPLLTLAAASQIFAAFYWIWGNLFAPQFSGFLSLVEVCFTFAIIILLSLFTPFFLLLALANQWLMRFILIAQYKGLH